MLLILATSALYGQGTSGTISGQVQDSSGAIIPGAKISALNVATNVATATAATATGNYNLTVYPGVYHITVEGPSEGFKRYSRSDLTVSADSSVRLDVVLELGSVAETVEVTGTAIQVETENARVSTTIENRFVDALPLVVGGRMRNPLDLVGIAAGVNSTGNTSIGGGQTGAWNVSLDGLGIGVNRPLDSSEMPYAAPSVEAVTEVTVETSGYKAEFGAASGGAVSFTSRSGTNSFHGSAYDFLRNDAFDARGFFAATKSIYRQNNFGAAAGGPVVLPKLYDGHNRTFVYMTYEGFRNRVGSTDTFLTVPTPEMKNGDFSNWVNSSGKQLVIYDPSTTRLNSSGTGYVRDPFVGNQIPKARWSSVTNSILKYALPSLPAPNRGAAVGTYGYVYNNYALNTGSTQSPQDKGSIKFDENFTPSHRVGFFLNISRFREQAGPDGFAGLAAPLYNGTPNTFDNSDWRATYDWIIKPTLLNHFQFGDNKFTKNRSTPSRTNDWKDKICIKNVIDCNAAFPTVSFTEGTSWSGAVASGHKQPSWAIKDDLSWTRGNHSMKFGVSYQYPPSYGTGSQDMSGGFNFSYLGTSTPAATSFASGSAWASFLLGDAQTGSTETYRENAEIYQYLGIYAQDDWRVSKKLTLNIGLRFEPSFAPTYGNDYYSDFTPTKPNPAVNNYPGALRFAGTGPGREGSSTLVPSWYGGWGPRFGIAYSASSKTTIRAAVGRSFNRNTVVRDAGHYQGFYARYSWTSGDSGITPAMNWDNGLPSYTLPYVLNPSAALDPAAVNNDAVHFNNGKEATRSPENFSWNLTIQRQISNSSVFEAGYSALIGTHLMASLLNFNQVPMSVWNSLVAKYGQTGARNLLLSQITSSTAIAAGITAPYANFTDPKVQFTRTVAQALRPFPQYTDVVTTTRGNGDHSGHSAYHALTLKYTRRYSHGLTFDANYVLSKILSDADAAGSGASQDQGNRSLEKSLATFDQTHSFKFNTVYELPIGKGKALLSNSRAADLLLGGWRIGLMTGYSSGAPVVISRTNPLPISNRASRVQITSYDNWQGTTAGDSFDPGLDRFFNINAFPTQPTDIGNSTRTNPKLRAPWGLNENISLAKKFSITEKISVDYRLEAFNLLNRVQFGTGSTNLSNSSTFGLVTSQANSPRQMQMGLKLYW